MISGTLEMNQRNEIRADVNMTIESMGLTEIEHMNDGMRRG